MALAAERRMDGRRAVAVGSKLYLRRAPQSSQRAWWQPGPCFPENPHLDGMGGWEHGPAGCQRNRWEWREGTDFSLNSQSHPSHSVLAHTGPGRPQISRVSHWTDVATSYSQRTTEEAKSNASLSRLSCHQRESQWGNCRSAASGMNGACGRPARVPSRGTVARLSVLAGAQPTGPPRVLPRCSPSTSAQTRDCSPPKSNQPSPRGSQEMARCQSSAGTGLCKRKLQAQSFKKALPRICSVIGITSVGAPTSNPGQLPAQAQLFTRCSAAISGCAEMHLDFTCKGLGRHPTFWFYEG